MTDAPTSLVVVDQWGREIAAQTSARRQGMGDGPFNPGMPLAPYAGYGVQPRESDYMSGYNIAARPRRDERVSFETLKGLVEAYDIAQICIWHRIHSIRSLEWALVAPPGQASSSTESEIAYARKKLALPDGVTPFGSWLTAFLYDVLAYDAGCIYRNRNNAGQAIGLTVIDGTTIAPLLSYTGGTPDAPAPAYVQFSQGVVWDWLDVNDLIYVPYQSTSGTPYGRAPIETILLNANTDLRFQVYFLQRFTAGTIPEAFASAPEGWTPTQIEDFQEYWDALLYGDDKAKHQVKWVPHGTAFSWTNEKEFTSEFSEFMAVKTAASYHVVPSDIGILSDVNRATSETQSDVQFRVGDLPLIQHTEGILTRYLQDDLGLLLEFKFDTGQEKEDRLNTAQANKIYVELGVVSGSEVRENVFGLSEPDGIPMPRFVMTPRGGPVPLSALYAVAGKVDAESGAPAPDALLPKDPFAPVEGVLANPPPPTEPLAVQRFGVQNELPAAPVGPPALPPGSPAPPAPVAKAETIGLDVETGAFGDPLIGATPSYLVESEVRAVGEEILGTDPAYFAGEEPGDVVKELATFRRYVKGARRRREWRDFSFEAFAPELAHRLNQAGRAEVRKAAGELVAAGLAVVAGDTGRVLMLQRALDPADPAGGMWEMPGGHIEDGEDPLTAACREWCEETGIPLPAGDVVDTWTSANGIYQGYVYLVPDEAVMHLIEDRGLIGNPDDPDGDLVEAIAWWLPSLLVDNPAVRSELAGDVEVVLAALTGHVLPETADAVAKAGGADPKARWRDGEPRVPQHSYDLRLTDHYAPLITAALRSLTSSSAIRAGIAAASKLVAKSADPSAADPLKAAAVGAISTDPSGLEAILRQLQADSYVAGAHAAAEQSGGYIRSAVGELAADVDWSTWQPGDVDAAIRAADGGLADLLDDADVTIRGIVDTQLDRLGNAIADGLLDGLSVDGVADLLDGIIDDPARAEMIAHTETARAVSAATMDTYTANGIELYEVLLADGACDECEATADGNPYNVDDGGQVPIHPYCRCAESPVSTAGSSDDTEPEPDEESE